MSKGKQQKWGFNQEHIYVDLASGNLTQLLKITINIAIEPIEAPDVAIVQIPIDDVSILKPFKTSIWVCLKMGYTPNEIAIQQG